MSDGGAQFWANQFISSSGTPYAGIQIYHYAAGTTTDKDVWIDEGRTTVAAQPVIGDSSGIVTFYGDGDYRLVAKDSGGNDLPQFDWDNVKITSDTSTMWEGNHGTSFPPVTTKSRWQTAVKHDSNNILEDVAISDGSAFNSLINFITSTKAALPSAGTNGRQRKVTDDVRGLWLDSGSQWYQLQGETINLDEYALGDGSDESALVQAAFDAVPSTGATIIIPSKTYICKNITVKSKTRVVGIGGGTLKYPDTVSSASTNQDNILRIHGDASANVTDIIIDGVIFDGNRSGMFPGAVAANLYGSLAYDIQTHAISIHGAQRVIIQNCYIHDAIGDGMIVWITYTATPTSDISIMNNVINTVGRNGISVTNAQRIKIIGNTINGFNTVGIDVEAESAGADPDNQMFVSGNWVTPLPVYMNQNNSERFYAISITLAVDGLTANDLFADIICSDNICIGVTDGGLQYPKAGIRAFRYLGVTISGNVVDACRDGINVTESISGDSVTYGSRIAISGNNVRNCRQRGISVEFWGTIVGNSIENCGQGINMTRSQNICAGNIIRNAGQYSYSLPYGILLDFTKNSVVTNNVIVDEQSTATMTYGIFATTSSGMDNTIVSQNNISGASTLAISVPAAGNRIQQNIGYVTENHGATSVASGGTIPHGLVGTPSNVQVTAGVAGPTDLSVVADATNLTVTYGGGGNNVIYWSVKMANSR